MRDPQVNGKALTDMTSTGTKNCRHCGEPILAVARVCKHCRSNQGWFSSQRDPRYLLLVLPIVLLGVALPLVLLSLMDRKSNREESCRGLVVAKATSYDVRTIEARVRLFVRVQVENRSAGDISDPVVRVEIVDVKGNVEDTFIRTVYGENIPPGPPRLLRVEGDTTVEKSSIKEVRAQVASASCKPAWK